MGAVNLEPSCICAFLAFVPGLKTVGAKGGLITNGAVTLEEDKVFTYQFITFLRVLLCN